MLGDRNRPAYSRLWPMARDGQKIPLNESLRICAPGEFQTDASLCLAPDGPFSIFCHMMLFMVCLVRCTEHDWAACAQIKIIDCRNVPQEAEQHDPYSITHR